MSLKTTVTYLNENENSIGQDNFIENIPWDNVSDPIEYSSQKTDAILLSIKKYYNCHNCSQVPANMLALQSSAFKIDSLNNSRFINFQKQLYLTLLNETIRPGDFVNHSHGKLDYYYELVKQLLTIGLPRSMSADDSLITYFRGDKALFSTQNIQTMLKNAISEIDNNHETTYLDWIKIINENVDSLKDYVHRKLDLSTANGKTETIIPINVTIKNLKLLKAKRP